MKEEPTDRQPDSHIEEHQQAEEVTKRPALGTMEWLREGFRKLLKAMLALTEGRTDGVYSKALELPMGEESMTIEEEVNWMAEEAERVPIPTDLEMLNNALHAMLHLIPEGRVEEHRTVRDIFTRFTDQIMVKRGPREVNERIPVTLKAFAGTLELNGESLSIIELFYNSLPNEDSDENPLRKIRAVKRNLNFNSYLEDAEDMGVPVGYLPLLPRLIRDLKKAMVMKLYEERDRPAVPLDQASSPQEVLRRIGSQVGIDQSMGLAIQALMPFGSTKQAPLVDAGRYGESWQQRVETKRSPYFHIPTAKNPEEAALDEYWRIVSSAQRHPGDDFDPATDLLAKAQTLEADGKSEATLMEVISELALGKLLSLKDNDSVGSLRLVEFPLQMLDIPSDLSSREALHAFAMRSLMMTPLQHAQVYKDHKLPGDEVLIHDGNIEIARALATPPESSDGEMWGEGGAALLNPDTGSNYIGPWHLNLKIPAELSWGPMVNPSDFWYCFFRLRDALRQSKTIEDTLEQLYPGVDPQHLLHGVVNLPAMRGPIAAFGVRAGLFFNAIDHNIAAPLMTTFYRSLAAGPDVSRNAFMSYPYIVDSPEVQVPGEEEFLEAYEGMLSVLEMSVADLLKNKQRWAQAVQLYRSLWAKALYMRQLIRTHMGAVESRLLLCEGRVVQNVTQQLPEVGLSPEEQRRYHVMPTINPNGAAPEVGLLMMDTRRQAENATSGQGSLSE